MWVDEFRLYLAEKFQEEIGLSQSNIDLSGHLFPATPKLSIGETQELKHILPYQAAKCLHKSLIPKPVCRS